MLPISERAAAPNRRFRAPPSSLDRLAHDAAPVLLPSPDRMRSTVGSSKGLLVTIVASHAATLDGLQGYLRAAGVVTAATRSVDRILDVTPQRCAAVILFADEYGASGVTKALTALRRARPTVLPVIVTSEPTRFLPRSRPRSDGLEPVVILKPPWAWTLLDAVRARYEARAIPSDAS